MSDKAKFDGLVILDEAELKLQIDLTALVAETALWANPEVHKILVREYDSVAWYPKVRRAQPNKGEKKGEIIRGVTLDNNTYANSAIRKALGMKRGDVNNFHTCHIWENSCYDDIDHTTIANLVLLPAPLSALSDHDPKVRAALKYRAYELYGWHPRNTSPPLKPKSYQFNWRQPLPYTKEIENSIRRGGSQ